MMFGQDVWLSEGKKEANIRVKKLLYMQLEAFCIQKQHLLITAYKALHINQGIVRTELNQLQIKFMPLFFLLNSSGGKFALCCCQCKQLR